MLPGAIASGVTMAFIGKLMPKATFDLRLFVVAGELIFAYAMWSHSLFTTLSGGDDFFWPMVLRGIGQGMVSIPLNNLALGNLPQEQIAPASDLYNLLRQLGGSVGIASSATLLTNFQEGNRGQLLNHLSQFADASTYRLSQLERLMASHGDSIAMVHQNALMLMDGCCASRRPCWPLSGCF